MRFDPIPQCSRFAEVQSAAKASASPRPATRLRMQPEPADSDGRLRLLRLRQSEVGPELWRRKRDRLWKAPGPCGSSPYRGRRDHLTLRTADVDRCAVACDRIDAASRSGRRSQSLSAARKNVDDSLTVFDNILDRDSVDAPSIRWLPARSRIESRAIQENPASFPARADHLCAKRLLIRIVVVQPFRGVTQSRCLPGYLSLLRH